MKNMFFIALMLTGQLFAQMEEGLYYSDETYYCDIENKKRITETKLNNRSYVEVSDNGVRFYKRGRIGLYHAWKYIGYFVDYETYLLSNNSKVCIGPEINGLYYFYEYSYDYYEYKQLIEFRNLTKILDKGSYVMDGNYLMEQ